MIGISTPSAPWSFVGFEVEAAIAERHAGDGAIHLGVAALGRLGAPQDGLHAGQELAQIDGLGEIVVRPHLEAHDAVDHVGRGRQHDDADIAPLAQEPGQGEAILLWHGDVEDGQIEALARGQAAQGRAVRRGAHAESVELEVFLEGAPDAFLVIDDDDMGSSVAHGSCPRYRSSPPFYVPASILSMRARTSRGVIGFSI